MTAITEKYGATRQCLSRLVAEITKDAYVVTPGVRVIIGSTVSRTLMDKLARCDQTELWSWCNDHQARLLLTSGKAESK